MKNLRAYVREEWEDTQVLLRCIPAIPTTLFILSVCIMNLLANKELFNYKYLALDCGFALSWIPFLFMDMICKRFGSKASVKLSAIALIVNLCMSCLFALLMGTPGHWGAYYETLPDVQTANIVDNALNSTLAGSWYVVLGSSVAMLASAGVNALLNNALGKLIHDETESMRFSRFAFRSFISTGVAQFVDNMVFALIVSRVFFGWTWKQVLFCSLVGAAAELLGEIVLSPIGFRIAKGWQRGGVGKAYIERERDGR